MSFKNICFHFNSGHNEHSFFFFHQTYLKEILNEVCDYNVKNPHRNMWELKPEYRHYKADEVEAADDPNSD